MFLAVPFVAIASVVYRHWLEWRSGDGVADATLLRTPAQAASGFIGFRASVRPRVARCCSLGDNDVSRDAVATA